MALSVRTAEYFYARITNEPDKAYQLLAELASEEVTLLAFSAVPYGSHHVELTLFPDNSDGLIRVATRLGWELTGPQHAVLIQGDDHLGALADIHKCLSEEGVRVFASTGVTDGMGHYGYVIYFQEEDHVDATRALARVAVTQ
jgi:hypothetical protein